MTSPVQVQAKRLAQVDALRGVAALAVVLFHYTTAFTERFAPHLAPPVSVRHGYLGVNLFFIISGFVILMTLARTRRPMDFIVSRFSRLFPAYWVAVALTFTVVSIFGLPSKEVAPWHALANFVMVHNIFWIPHVDGVYWTLEVELIFYAGMLALFAAGRLDRVHFALWAMLALRLIYAVAERGFGLDFSWTLYRLTILKHIPWFALGIVVYQFVVSPGRAQDRQAALTAILALACLMAVDGWVLACVAVVLGLMVWGAATGRLPWLDNPELAFLGTISYTLYLLHENIGWVVQREVIARGGSFSSSIFAALGVAVILATALTYTVEKPAMQWVRARHRRRLTAASS